MRQHRQTSCAASGLCSSCWRTVAVPAASPKTTKKNSPTELRSDYIARLREQDAPACDQTVGSLWSPSGEMNDISSDYKARKLNDTIVILVAVQTTAAQSGTSTSQRTFQTSSGDHRPGRRCQHQRPESAVQRKLCHFPQGSGSDGFKHDIPDEPDGAGHRGAAQRQPDGRGAAQDLHEQPARRRHWYAELCGPTTSGPATPSLPPRSAILKIEMKGKGIIADSTRRLNAITRAILWLIGF